MKETIRKTSDQELLNFFGPLMRVSLLLMTNVLKLLVKIVLVPLGLTKATLTSTDAAIQKNIYGSATTMKWMIS